MTTPSNAATDHRARRLAVVIGCEAAALAVMSALHLSGAVAGGSPPFKPHEAGIHEAVICAVLAAGAAILARRSSGSRPAAAVAVSLAILGFCIGLYFTVQGGDPIDLAFHATMLPLLALTLTALLVAPRPRLSTRSER